MPTHSDPEVQGTRGASGREVTTCPVKPQPPGPEVGGGRAGRCPMWIKQGCYFILHVSYFGNTHVIINTGRVCPEVRVWRVQAGSQPQASGRVPAAPPRGDSLHGTDAPSLQGGQEPRGPHTSPSTAGICCPGARAPGPCGPPGPRGRRPSLGNWEEASGGSAGAREAECRPRTGRREPGPALLSNVGSHLPPGGPSSPPEGGVLTQRLDEPFVWTFYHNEGDPGVRRGADLFRQNLSSPGVTVCSQGSALGERPHLQPSLR